jgi:hypothetical protein
MTATPTVHVFVAGEVATAANINLFGTVANFLKTPPILEMNQTVAQSIASSSTPTAGLTFTTEVVDSSGMHSTSTNTSRCTAVYPGWYEGGGGYAAVASATGQRGCAWAVTGAALNGGFSYLTANASGFTAVPARGKKFFLNAGTDYVELWPAQTSGGALNTSTASLEQSSLSLKWISD